MARRITVFVGMALTVLAASMGVAQAMPAERVAVCRQDAGTGDYKRIEVNERATQNSGRGPAAGGPGDPVPGEPNATFGEDCSVVHSLAKAGCFQTATDWLWVVTDGTNPQLASSFDLYSDSGCTDYFGTDDGSGIGSGVRIVGLIWAEDDDDALTVCADHGGNDITAQGEPGLYACFAPAP